MTKSNSLPPRRRLMPIDRLAGVAMQFERTDGGWFFRRHGHGPAVRVTAAERDAFAGTALRSALVHAAAMALCGTAGWLIVMRLMQGQNIYLRAVAIGIVLSLIGAALYASLRWNADAPGRALAGRPVERPARDPDYLEHGSYGTIGGGTLIILFIVALGTSQPPWVYATFATVVVMGGIFAALAKWRFERALTPVQQARAAQARAHERALEEDRVRTRTRNSVLTRGQAVLLVSLTALQFVAMIGGFIAGLYAAFALAGTTAAAASGDVIGLAIVAGLLLAALLMWGIERLCKRLTGESSLEPFTWVPGSW